MAKIVFRDGQELNTSEEIAALLVESGGTGITEAFTTHGNKEKHVAVSMEDVLYVEFEKDVQPAEAQAPAQPDPSASAPADQTQPSAQADQPAAPVEGQPTV